MQASDDSSGQPLLWLQPERRRSYLVLRKGSVELATFERDQQRPTQILLTFGSESWLLLGQQLFDPAVKIYPGPARDRAADAQPLAWLDSESRFPELRLLLADGRCYCWVWRRSTALASCTCQMLSTQGPVLLRIHMPAWQPSRARLKDCQLQLFPAAEGLTELPLLVALSPYILLLGQEESGPAPRRRSLAGEEVVSEVLEAIVTFLGELLGHLH
ncbi:MAG: hypothetical protein IRZ31_21185 [Thermogemmatispora sp.]|uniref:Uncharacterized protein n=1 Tax=Thermogemmatispora tikiterensis TaxID=1825093 RepID=A0A328VQ26_9CHLR|nr:MULTISPECIES: hypothetical protein [Thermogemmatispora]MBX5459413.1 hypothetical protein [Thermogemmatispora sp.]RAQ97793.1 hypothetical protein A4R35_19795 [Thermogemmatispora tikiterensis]